MMYPSRTERKKANEQAKEKHQLRVWTIINVVFIVVITAVFTYFFVFMEEEEQTGTEPSFYNSVMAGSSEQGIDTVYRAFALGA